MAESGYLSALTDAEMRSSKTIGDAHEKRDKRIKEAKFDAEQEVAKLRSDMEGEFSRAQAEQQSGSAPDAEYSQATTDSKIKEQQDLFEENQNKMTDFLIESALRVDLSVPAVVKGKFE